MGETDEASREGEESEGREVTKQELIEKLRELKKDADLEMAHVDADDYLLEYINDPQVTEAFHAINKWYA